MKKFALFFVAAVVSVGLLVGCGTSGGSASSASGSLAASDKVSASSVADSTSSAAASIDAQSQRAASTYTDTRQRTVNPVQQPEGSLVKEYGEAVGDGGDSVIGALEDDMTSGVIPIQVSVYVDDTSDPFVICTSADDVVNFYNAITKINIGDAAAPSDSTYYAVEFLMQNGDVADFEFTGRDTIVVNGETRAISNADDLWAQVQVLIDEAEE